MNTDINITITGIQKNGSQEDEVTSTLPATYYFKNNKHYILYNEYLIEGQENSLNKNTVIISAADDKASVNLIKRGYQNSQLIFSQGEKFATSYKTPYGVFLMQVETTSLEISIDVDNINATIEYDLYLNDEFTSHNKIIIDVVSKR